MNPYRGSDPQSMKEPLNREYSFVVSTEGRLIIEFSYDDLLRIRSWHFSIRNFQELIPRSLIAYQLQQDPSMLDQISKNITRQGLTNATLNYLRLCVILEPMRVLMIQSKQCNLPPRECLNELIIQKWHRTPAVTQEPPRPANKRRKRKTSTTPNCTTPTMTPSLPMPGPPNKKKSGSTMSPGTPNFALLSQDVMVVGEPSWMGGEFGDEDERIITRLENTQYDPEAAAATAGSGASEVSGPGVGRMGVSNGLEDPDEFRSMSVGPRPPSNASSVNQNWANSNPGSVSSTNDRGNVSSNRSSTPSSALEDKKTSPLTQ